MVISKDSIFVRDIVSIREVLFFNGKYISSIVDLIEELINVVWLLLGYGVEVNIRDTELKIFLYIILLRLYDLRMV